MYILYIYIYNAKYNKLCLCVYTHERTRISRVCVFTHARDTRVRETHTLSLSHTHTHTGLGASTLGPIHIICIVYNI